MNTERNRNTESGFVPANVNQTDAAKAAGSPIAHANALQNRRGFHWVTWPDLWFAGLSVVGVAFIAASLRMDLMNEPTPPSNIPTPPSIWAISVFVIANLLLVAFTIFTGVFLRRMQSATPPERRQS